MPSGRRPVLPALLIMVTGFLEPVAGQVSQPPSVAGPREAVESEPLLQVSQEDTVAAYRMAQHILRDYYGGTAGPSSLRAGRRSSSSQREFFEYCDGGAGELCHGGDPDRGRCPAGSTCHMTEEFLLKQLVEGVEEHPTSGLILGQAVYNLAKFGHLTRALVLAEQCQADAWWCDTLLGYVLHAQGRSGEAEPFFRRVMDTAPIPLRCSLGDGLWLLGEWSQERAAPFKLPPGRETTAEWPCLDRLEVSDTLFWLGDPLYSVEGNERWVEHMARATGIFLYLQIRDLVRGGRPVAPEYRDLTWALRIRRGVWDSWRQSGSQGTHYWTSEEKAPYHFLPRVEPGDLSSPEWRMDGDLFDEGFKPAFSPFFSIPAQVARFRIGDSLRVLAAGALEGTPLEEAPSTSAQFILTDGPGSFPLFLTGNTFRANAIFLGQGPARDYVVGLEVLSGVGVGWYREFIPSLVPTGPELSDLLLFQPREGMEPDSLLQAAGLMLSSLTIGPGEDLGVFWEVYGAEAETELELELALLGESGGGISRLLPGRGGEAYGPVRWTETAEGSPHATSLRLELGNLDSGEYELVLKVRWEGEEEMERRRQVRIN